MIKLIIFLKRKNSKDFPFSFAYLRKAKIPTAWNTKLEANAGDDGA